MPIASEADFATLRTYEAKTVSELKEPDRTKLEEFKTQLKQKPEFNDFFQSQHFLSSDFSLLRFLRARKLNTNDATTMLQNSLKWRETHGMDQAYTDMKLNPTEEEAMNKYLPQYFHSVNKSGEPILWESYGKLKAKELFEAISEERILKYLAVDADRTWRDRYAKASVVAQKHIQKNMLVLDIGGLSIVQMWTFRNTINKTLTSLLDNFPECAGSVRIINAPWTFDKAYHAIIKPCLDEVTASKVAVYDSHWRKKIASEIDAANIPKAYGGSCESCPQGCETSGRIP